MENKGFIMIDRSILEDDMYFSEKFTRMQAYMDLCLLAAFKSRTFYIRGNKVELQPMQVAKSVRDLADRWQWSVNKVRGYLYELEKGDYIDTQKTSVNQIITIKKYIVVNTQNDTQINTQTDTQNDTQTDTPIIKNNNVNNENKEIVIEDKSSLSVPTDEQPTNDTKKKSKASKVPSIISVGDKQIVTDELLRYWNSAMEGRVISKLKQITEKRAKFVKIRLSNFTPEDIFKVIDKAAISDFLNGRVGNRGFTANFDWIFENESHFIKVLEGRYDNVSLPSKPTQQSLFPSTSNNNNNNNNNGLIQNNYDTGTSGNAEYDSYLAGLRNAGVINENTERSYKQDYRLGKQSQANMQREREQRLANGETQIKDCPDLSELDIWMD